MTTRERNLLALICYVLFGAACWSYFYGSPFEYFRSIARAHTEPGLDVRLKEFEQVQAAERLSDPVERCLAYPNPVEFTWDPDVVKALCAQRSRSALSVAEIAQALDAHDTAHLQEVFDGYLKRNFEPGQHGLLIWVYEDRFSNATKETEQLVQRWVELDPQSAYARAARGTYYMAAAYQARGQNFAGKTSSGQFESMGRFAASAREDLEESLRMNPRLIAAYRDLIRVARVTGDGELLANSARKALKLDPADLAIYDAWSNAVAPRWGGSQAQMQEIAEQALQHAADNPLLKRIATRIECDEATSIKTYTERLDRVRSSAATVPSKCFVDEASDTAEWANDKLAALSYSSQTYRFLGDEKHRLRRAALLEELGRRDLALQDLDLLLGKQPHDVEARIYKGWFLKTSGRSAEAEKTFLDVLADDPDHREANSSLVGIYTAHIADYGKAQHVVDALMARDPRNPRAWLLQSVVDWGDAEKSRGDLEKYLDLVDQNTGDEYEQRDIQSARQRLKGLGTGRAAVEHQKTAQ